MATLHWLVPELMQRNMTTSLIHPSMVYACHSVGCHDICHSRIEERGERRHHSHRARCGSRQSSPIGKLRLASSACRTLSIERLRSRRSPYNDVSDWRNSTKPTGSS